MKFKFTDPRKVGKSLSPKQAEQLSRWEKERADGKWFWIFKRFGVAGQPDFDVRRGKLFCRRNG